jgi:hypothetical protein
MIKTIIPNLRDSNFFVTFIVFGLISKRCSSHLSSTVLRVTQRAMHLISPHYLPSALGNSRIRPRSISTGVALSEAIASLRGTGVMVSSG